MPDEFLLKSVVFKQISKEISRAEHEYMNIPPPPPPINALATALEMLLVIRCFEINYHEHRGQTFAHARVVVRAEPLARTKTEEKYTSERLHKALEKRVNKITRG